MQNWKDNCVSSELRQSGFQVCPKETSPCGAEAAPPLDPVTGAPTLGGLFCSPQSLHSPQDKESMAKGNGRPEPTSPFVDCALATPGIPCTDALSQRLRPSKASSPVCLPKDGPLPLRMAICRACRRGLDMSVRMSTCIFIRHTYSQHTDDTEAQRGPATGLRFSVFLSGGSCLFSRLK